MLEQGGSAQRLGARAPALGRPAQRSAPAQTVPECVDDRHDIAYTRVMRWATDQLTSTGSAAAPQVAHRCVAVQEPLPRSSAFQTTTVPQPIAGSESAFPACPSTSGQVFDGFYPSFMSPGAPAGHTRLTGLAFFLNGCDTGQPRALSSRAFTITVEP